MGALNEQSQQEEERENLSGSDQAEYYFFQKFVSEQDYRDSMEQNAAKLIKEQEKDKRISQFD